VDRDKLHYIDFEGEWFSVRGPSIVPRPPQGQPLVTAAAHATVPYRFGARSTDVVYVTPHGASEALVMTQEVRAEQEAAGRHGEPVLVFADLVVFLDETASAMPWPPRPTSARCSSSSERRRRPVRCTSPRRTWATSLPSSVPGASAPCLRLPASSVGDKARIVVRWARWRSS